MLLKIISPFKVEEHNKDPTRSSISSSSSPCCHNNNNNMKKDHKLSFSSPTTTMGQVGLRIIVSRISSQHQNSNNNNNIYTNNNNNNVVMRSINIPAKKPSAGIDSNCFLKTCHLCYKRLRLDKEVYMYRGDQGFCSKECRERQIIEDEKRELEASTKKMVEAYRNSYGCNSRASETRSILQDLVHSRKTYMNSQNQKTNNNNNNRPVFIF